ncbi:MAG TPA: CTQ-dependent lysine 6-oxidase LodA [Thermoanaerobaculia bacterium]|jgi:L-lysine 6-oxidase|nr:CTQ-dependent lysine 6-oxidase LodA [Thermoanaerobaculia bacterium]
MVRVAEWLRALLDSPSPDDAATADSGLSRREVLMLGTVAAAAAATRLEAAEPAVKSKPKKPVPPERRRFAIHPAVGVARLGNSPDGFYLAPESIGGLPIQCDAAGRAKVENGRPVPVRTFKDEKGRILRQAAQFRLYAFDSADPLDAGHELNLADSSVESIEWTVHLANKKAVWYDNDELIGNTMLATARDPNYYLEGSFRNPDVEGNDARRKNLIIDPGPRSVSRPGATARFSRDTIPPDYPKGGFPPIEPGVPRVPYEIDTLGDLLVDPDGRLLVLGGHGRAGGQVPIATYIGQDTWFDDTSDGPVTCRLKLRGRAEPIVLTAWALIGSPKFAPELRNVSSLDDVLFDVGVRFQGLVPEMYSRGQFNPGYIADYDRDIQPILERIGDFMWVANVPSMSAFAAPPFDVRDPSERNRAHRETFFSYFRDSSGNEISAPHQELMRNGIPLVPLNSGSNSVTNQKIDKFQGLTNTQYFLLGQWAKGKFTVGRGRPFPVHALDRAAAGNCVGHPMSPGIEVTWTLRNPVLYESPYRIKHFRDEAYYREHGLSPDGDESGGWYARVGLPAPAGVVVQDGCEPGDLTKRMSPPWMADFYQCTTEYINFSDPKRNATDITQIPPPPTYYAYWWPPQAPMYVMTGGMTQAEQNAAGVPAGYSVLFLRGANNIANLVIAWSYMGFIVNQNTTPEGRSYPYFVERERNHEKFVASAVAVGHPINQLAASGSYLTPTNVFVPTWYLKEEGEIAECDGVPDCQK